MDGKPPADEDDNDQKDGSLKRGKTVKENIDQGEKGDKPKSKEKRGNDRTFDEFKRDKAVERLLKRKKADDEQEGKEETGFTMIDGDVYPMTKLELADVRKSYKFVPYDEYKLTA